MLITKDTGIAINFCFKLIKIAKVKHPPEKYNVYWFFDQSLGHTAFSDDALVASRMNVKPGGVIHDTNIWVCLIKWCWLMELQRACFARQKVHTTKMMTCARNA